MAKKKTAKKATAKSRRKQCGAKKCRKGRLDGSEFCRDHQPGDPAVPDPIEAVSRLSELDRLRFVEGDTALHNHTLEIKNLDQEQRLDAAAADQRKTIRQHRVNELQAAINVRMAEQRQLLDALGAKYGFDPAVASIDDKTGTIQVHEKAK